MNKTFEEKMNELKKEACPKCERLCFNCIYGIPNFDSDDGEYDCAFEFITEMYKEEHE